MVKKGEKLEAKRIRKLEKREGENRDHKEKKAHKKVRVTLYY